MTPRNESAHRPGRALPTASKASGKLSPAPDTLKRLLADPATALDVLGVRDRARRQGRGFVLLCPWHTERTPSCSVTTGPDGTLRAHCFGCRRGGDVINLAAAVLGLNERADFPQLLSVLAARCGIAGDVARPLPALPPLRPAPPASRPPTDEVRDLFARCLPVCDDPALSVALLGRSLDPALIADRDLARCLPPDGPLPAWARYAGQSWRASGHRLIVPLFDGWGAPVSLHARSFATDADPKGLSPAGYSSAGLVMADGFARDVLARGWPAWWNRSEPLTLVIAEGVPDYLTDASVFGEWEHAPATLGVISGAWSADVAARIPDGCRVIIRTHDDEAGRRYRHQIGESLHARCHVEVAIHG